MSPHPILLKPAVEVESGAEGLRVSYRGQRIDLDAREAQVFTRLQSFLDGTRMRDWVLAAIPGSDGVLEKLDRASMVVALDGSTHHLGSDSSVTGECAFWQLEANLCRLKFGMPRLQGNLPLESAIARGEVRQEVAEGYLIEVGYLMRHVPHELSLAVSTSPSHMIRMLYTQFFLEECLHGQLMLDQLVTWIPIEQLLAMRPLASTVAVLNLYAALASAGPLHYAVALMHDESSPLDPLLSPEDDHYAGLSRHFRIPSNVVDVFRWHANLDRENSHGFFPLEIFRAVGRVEASLLAVLRRELYTLFETRALWRHEIAEFYATASIRDRI